MTEKLLSPTKIAPNLRFSSNLKHFGFKESRHTRISADNNLKRKIVLFLIYVVVTQKNRLVETVLLRPNNIRSRLPKRVTLRKVFLWHSLASNTCIMQQIFAVLE